MSRSSLPRIAAALAFFAGALHAQSALTILNTSFPVGTVGTSYSQVLQASGGTPPYTWSVTGQLPAGLSVAAVGTLFGTPTAGGTYNFVLNVNDSRSNTASKSFSLIVTGPGGRPSISTTSLPAGTVGTAYSQTLTATGGTAPYTWAAGQLPAGLTLTPAGGLISGTPTAAGTFSFPVQVTDSANNSATSTLSLTINPSRLSISTTAIFTGTIGIPYAQTFTATGGTPPYTWSIESGSTGDLKLDATSGTLQGTPTTAGTFTFTIKVSDAGGRSATQSFSLVVNTPTLVITLGGTLPAGAVGVAYNQRIPVTATGGTPPYTWSIAAASTLPPGLAFTPSTLTLSGTPTTAGAYTFTLEVHDSASAVASRSISLTINAPALSFTSSRQLPNGVLNQAYTTTIAASGGVSPYRWSATGLATGLSINAATGQISGTPAAAGNFGIAVTVTDNALTTISDRFTLNVNFPPPPGVTVAGLPATADPAQQIPLQITLSEPFAAPMTGQAVLTFAPESGPTDRTVQFASGGTIANFNIPSGNITPDEHLAIQTGTVAGTITVTLRLQAGGIDITPSPAPLISTQILRAAPVIRSITVNRSGNTLNLVVTGYSTAREITQGVFGFSAASGQSLQSSASSITIDVNTLFGNWFQDPNNSQFGSVFTLTQPFTISGDVNAVIPAKVTLTNRVGSTSFDISQ